MLFVLMHVIIIIVEVVYYGTELHWLETVGFLRIMELCGIYLLYPFLMN